MPTRRARNFFFGPDGVTYKKFSTKNRPNKQMFRFLFDAIGFITESDDTATTIAQGFSKLGSDANAIARNSTKDVDGYNKVPQLHQLPRVAADKDESRGDTNNKLQVTQTTETANRTGGSGVLFVIKNIMQILSSVSFVNITQSAPGANATLTFDSSAFDTAVSNTTTITNMQAETVDMKKNKPFEPAWYFHPTKELGDADCEFDANGIARAVGINGATGKWVGWIIPLGQTASGIATTDSGVLLANYVSGGLVYNQKQKFQTFIDPGDASYKKMMSDVGANTITLTAAQSGIQSHNHSLTGAPATGGTHLHQIAYPATGSNVANTFEGAGSKDLDGYGYTGPMIAPSGVDFKNPADHIADGSHSHAIGTLAAVAHPGAAASVAHSNVPLSTVMALCIYVNAVGSTS